ncbi:hypothetical protein H632_c2837p0 [Helicosporidium sp. ATCC 50920]|nr:hypothetical protein H632_c2837p0 [Helicosporidium sp. ATCC 50920]|eukprot:KDD72834.1 hypothetical protein H632_c2837p0 [Helicosporidium sp. ATCC 50920]
MILDIRDLSSSILWFLACQTWYTLICSIITMISTSFFTYFDALEKLAAPLDWTLVSFTVILPAVVFLAAAFQRRERALDALSSAKLRLTSLHVLYGLWSASSPNAPSAEMSGHLADLAAELESFLLPPRFYSQYYPYLGFRSAMLQIALDRSRHEQRRRALLAGMASCVAALAKEANLDGAREIHLHDGVRELGLACQRLADVKEFRTPQGVRSLTRVYVGLVVPIFFGPYWAWVAQQTNFGFAFFFSVIMEMALVGVMNAAISLEDPFDNLGMDGVFVPEALFEIQHDLDAALGRTHEAPEDEENADAPVTIPTDTL